MNSGKLYYTKNFDDLINFKDYSFILNYEENENHLKYTEFEELLVDKYIKSYHENLSIKYLLIIDIENKVVIIHRENTYEHLIDKYNIKHLRSLKINKI